MNTNPKIQGAIDFLTNMSKIELNDISNFWADNHQVCFPSGSQPMNKDMHLGYIRMFLEAFPDLTFDIKDSFISGNKVTMRGFFNGTHKGDFNGIPPTGKNVKVSWIEIFEMDDNNKIVNELVEMDGIGMLKQLGVIP